ncbi:MAG: AAA family ATPase [Candidatus Bathyarchaeia archaeon]
MVVGKIFLYGLMHLIFMKKKTLLYLDSDLVEKAKKENLDISKLTEEAIKETLKVTIPKTARDYLQIILAEAGREDARYCEVHLLPFQIESLRLEDVGPFKEFEAKFKKGALNVIYGPCGSGKSTIVRAILLAFGIRHKYSFSKTVNGKITLKLFPDQHFINIMVNKENPLDAAKSYRCLIGDNFFDRIPKRMVPEICKEMKNLQIQTIITASMIVDPSMFPEDTNIIFLDDSEP